MVQQKKTHPVLAVCISAFILGMIIGGWGWDKNESTIPKRTKGGVFMMWTGGIMIAGGLIGMALIGGRKEKS